MKTVYLLCLGFLLVNFFSVPPGNHVVVGKMVSVTNKHPGGMIIRFKVDSGVIATVFTDTNGAFTQELLPRTDIVDVYCSDLGMPERYVGSVHPTRMDSTVLNISIPAVYKKKAGKAICPKCKLTDQTREIEYGDGTEGGCIITDNDPQYSCERDKIRF